MSKAETKTNKTLTQGQIEVLHLLFKFRFATNDLVAAYFGKKDRSFVHKRMSILLERGLVGRRFEKSYKLLGKPAAYYLTAEGARQLQAAKDVEFNIKAIYKDGELSEQFVGYSLELLGVYNRLRVQYGDALQFFTRSLLNREKYEYFPQPLPNAYMSVKVGEQKKRFFVELLHDDQPYFVGVRKILQYIKYSEEGDWEETGTHLPTVLLVCESERLAKRVQKRVVKAVEESWDEDELEFAVTTKQELLSGKVIIWRTEVDGKPLALEQLGEWEEE